MEAFDIEKWGIEAKKIWFVRKVTSTVIEEIDKRLTFCQHKVSVTVRTGPCGQNKYFEIKKKSSWIRIAIMDDGDVNVAIGDKAHKGITIPLVCYNDLVIPNDALEQVRDVIDMLFNVFDYSLHCYFDHYRAHYLGRTDIDVLMDIYKQSCASFEGDDEMDDGQTIDGDTPANSIEYGNTCVQRHPRDVRPLLPAA